MAKKTNHNHDNHSKKVKEKENEREKKKHGESNIMLILSDSDFKKHHDIIKKNEDSYNDLGTDPLLLNTTKLSRNSY